MIIMLQTEIDKLYSYYDEENEYFDEMGRYKPLIGFPYIKELAFEIVSQDTMNHAYSNEAMARKLMIFGEPSYYLEEESYLSKEQLKKLAWANNRVIGQFGQSFYNQVCRGKYSKDDMKKIFPISDEVFDQILNVAKNQLEEDDE